MLLRVLECLVPEYFDVSSLVTEGGKINHLKYSFLRESANELFRREIKMLRSQLSARKLKTF